MEKQLLFKRMMLVASLVSTIGLQAGGGNVTRKLRDLSQFKPHLQQQQQNNDNNKNVPATTPAITTTTTTDKNTAKSWFSLPSLPSLPSVSSLTSSLRYPTLTEGGVVTGSVLGLGALAKYTTAFSTVGNAIGSAAGYVRDVAVSGAGYVRDVAVTGWNDGFTLPSKGLELAASFAPEKTAAIAKFAAEHPAAVSRTIVGTGIVAGALAAYGAYSWYNAPKALTAVENLEACRLALKEEFVQAFGLLELGQNGDNKSMKNANTFFANIENRFAKNDENLRLTLKAVVSSLRDAYNVCKNNIEKVNSEKAAGKSPKAAHRDGFVTAYAQADNRLMRLVMQAQEEAAAKANEVKKA
jgi:hypothetical protein